MNAKKPSEIKEYAPFVFPDSKHFISPVYWKAKKRYKKLYWCQTHGCKDEQCLEELNHLRWWIEKVDYLFQLDTGDWTEGQKLWFSKIRRMP